MHALSIYRSVKFITSCAYTRTILLEVSTLSVDTSIYEKLYSFYKSNFRKNINTILTD